MWRHGSGAETAELCSENPSEEKEAAVAALYTGSPSAPQLSCFDDVCYL